MPNMQIEFTNDTLVLTSQGVERLEDILHRPVIPCLWAIKWQRGFQPNGISFHKAHRAARDFAEQQIDSTPNGCSRLVNVSKHIMKEVEENGFYWTNLSDFEQAETYGD
jgi:hypothetical protein